MIRDATTIEVIAEGGDVDDGDERVIIVTNGRYLVELEVNKGLSGWAFGPHPLGYRGVGEEVQVAKIVDLAHVESVNEGGASFRLGPAQVSLSCQKGVDSRERNYSRVPDGVLVGSGGLFPIIEDRESS